MKKILLKFIILSLIPGSFPMPGKMLPINCFRIQAGAAEAFSVSGSSRGNRDDQPADSAAVVSTPADSALSGEVPELPQEPAGDQPADSAAAVTTPADSALSGEIPELPQEPAGDQPADSAAAVTTPADLKPFIYDTDWSWLPMGEICFADSVLFYDPGKPGLNTGGEPDSRFTDPELCLGPPSENTTGFVSLGSGGTLVLQFNNNVVYDGPGPDLYFWIPDSVPEEATVWISRDGVVFLHAGQISSESPFLDLAGVAVPGEFYTQLKIRDDSADAVRKGSLGIDLDAVASINNAIIIPIPADSLFSELNLKSEAARFLKPVVQTMNDYPGCDVLIEVYTKNSGAADFNLLLSQQQAKLIRDYLKFKERLVHYQYSAIGLGKQQFYNPYKKRLENRALTAIIIFKE